MSLELWAEPRLKHSIRIQQASKQASERDDLIIACTHRINRSQIGNMLFTDLPCVAVPGTGVRLGLRSNVKFGSGPHSKSHGPKGNLHWLTGLTEEVSGLGLVFHTPNYPLSSDTCSLFFRWVFSQGPTHTC